MGLHARAEALPETARPSRLSAPQATGLFSGCLCAGCGCALAETPPAKVDAMTNPANMAVRADLIAPMLPESACPADGALHDRAPKLGPAAQMHFEPVNRVVCQLDPTIDSKLTF